MYETTYNSDVQKEFKTIDAPYYNAIVTSEITFEKEQVVATIDSLGHIEFFDLEKNSLGFVDVPVSKDPSEKGHTAQYGDARYSSDGKVICFELPVYGWEDSYPHCDGESDRWSRYVARWFSVVFDCDEKKISIIGL